MQAIVYANLSTHKLTTSAGTSAYTLPALVQGDTVRMGLRFTEIIEGGTVEISKNVVSLKATIGFADTPPTGGKFILQRGTAPFTNANQTIPLAYDSPSTKIDLALTAIGVANAKVTALNGSWIISNNGARIVGLHGVSAPGDAALYPTSIVRVREVETNGTYSYDLRLMQAPLASTSSFTPIVPPAPQVERIQGGDSSGTTVWPEIQSLYLSPAFRGVYQIRRGYKRTVELSAEDGPDEIKEALAALADEGGSFEVSNPATNIAHIKFMGDMAGIPQDLLTIVVFAAPEGDATFTIDLGTAELAAALRAAPEIKPLFEIEVVVEDDNDPEIHHTYTVHRATVSIFRELNWDGLEVGAGIDWLRPPHGISYVPFTLDQIIHGTRNYVAPFGDGTALEFDLSHNLDSLNFLPPAIIDNSNGALLTQGVDYDITASTEDTITVVTLASEPWPLNGLKMILGLVGPASAFQTHHHSIGQIDGLQLILDDLGERVVALENLLPAFMSRDDNALVGGPIATWELPKIFEIYPTRTKLKDVKDVADIKTEDLPRAGGLLPAAYTTVAPTDSNGLPSAPVNGTVYKSTSPTPFILPGYLGRSSLTIEQNANFAFDGRGFYGVEKVVSGDNVYYPTDFVRELFRLPVNAKQLRLNKTFLLDLSFIVAVLKANVSAQWGIVIDIGLASAEGTASPNLFDLNYLPPSLDHTFIVGPVPSSHNFGLRITRKLVNSVDTLLVDRVIYGAVEATTTGLALPGATFVVRGRLHRFDTQDNKTDPRGLIAFNGLDADFGETSDSPFGKASIE